MNFTQQLTAESFTTSSEVDSASHRASGWPALLSNCERLHAAGNPNLFIGAMGINCQVGAANKTITVPQFYMSGSLRVDSMAWAGCKLLYIHRQPTLCQTPVVTRFLARYGFDDTEATPEMLALPNSDAEAELLALLEVIAKSAPLHRVTCVEGFAYSGAGFYKTHIYGCGAPNVYQSAFVGLHATAFKHLHQDKAWLTVDTINLMGFKYILRQNCYSEFTATVDETTSELALQHKTVTNFASSGALYTLMVVVDVLLIAIHLGSAMEIVRLMIIPLLLAPSISTPTSSTTATTTSTPPSSDLHAESQQLQDAVEDYKTVLTCSLYRSRPIVLLTVATQLLSWVIIVPNATIWTWSTAAKEAKIQAYLSSLRLWVLILVLLNEIWDVVVFVHERFAYEICKRTYIASHEIVVVGALVSYWLRHEIFAVTGAKYTRERQRNRDAASFVGHTAFGNSYNPLLDGELLNTPVVVLWVLYKPLVDIILWSLVGVVVFIVVRLVVLELWQRRRQRRTAKIHHQPTTVSYRTAAVVAAAVEEHDEAQSSGGQQLFSSPNTVTVLPQTVANNTCEAEDSAYVRLPLELLLNVPIRARSLVRGSLEIETHDSRSSTRRGSRPPDRYIRAPFLLEHGVVVDHGHLRPRHGFFSFLQPTIELTPFVQPATSNAPLRHAHRSWRQRLKWA